MKHTVEIHVNQKAAFLAGYDQHGWITHEIEPASLSERHRQALAYHHFRLGETAVGYPIDGTESLLELLDKAADKLDAEREKEQQRVKEAVQSLCQKIMTSPDHNPFEVDSETGCVDVEIDRDALLQVSAAGVSKSYQSLSFFYTGPQCVAEKVRGQVLQVDDVIDRLEQLDFLADDIRHRLDAARDKRRLLAEKCEREKEEYAAAQAQEREEFVMSHMGPVAQRRRKAGLMPDTEIYEAMEEKSV